jgi:hypothetical protein
MLKITSVLSNFAYIHQDGSLKGLLQKIYIFWLWDDGTEKAREKLQF